MYIWDFIFSLLAGWHQWRYCMIRDVIRGGFVDTLQRISAGFRRTALEKAGTSVDRLKMGEHRVAIDRELHFGSSCDENVNP